VEYCVFGLPRPDAVILLDVPVATSQQLIARKPQRTYTDKAADLQEADRGYLDHVADVYRTLAQSRDNWHTIDCVIDGELQSVEQIGEAIERVVRDVRRES
jgi:dTMP kinase